MRMNGWHRLWVLTSILALVLCAIFVNASWPDERSISHSPSFYEALDPNALAQIAENDSASNIGVEMPNGHVINLKPEVAASRKTEALIQYHEAVVAELRSKQRHLFFQVSMVWFIYCAMTLGLGHLVAWVIRGFRENARKPTN